MDVCLLCDNPNLISIQPREDEDCSRSFSSDHLAQPEHNHLLARSHLDITVHLYGHDDDDHHHHHIHDKDDKKLWEDYMKVTNAVVIQDTLA